MATTVYRISKAEYAASLSGEGSRRFGGRWNERGTPALYAAESIALALLEVLVHVGDLADLPDQLVVSCLSVEISVADRVEQLPKTKQASQKMGQQRLTDARCLGFWVPSVIVPREYNLVLNPRAADFGTAVSIEESFVLEIDERLGR